MVLHNVNPHKQALDVQHIQYSYLWWYILQICFEMVQFSLGSFIFLAILRLDQQKGSF